MYVLAHKSLPVRMTAAAVMNLTTGNGGNDVEV